MAFGCRCAVQRRTQGDFQSADDGREEESGDLLAFVVVGVAVLNLRPPGPERSARTRRVTANVCQ